MSTTRSTPTLGILLSISGVVVAVGSVTLGASPTLAGIGVALVAVVAVYLIRRPTVMLVILIVAEVTNFAAVTQLPIFSPLIGLGLLTVGILLRDPAMRQRLNRWTLLGVGLVSCYLVTQLLAVLGSQNVDASTTRLIETILDCTFLLVVLILVQLTGRPWVVAQALVVSLVVLSVLSLVNQLFFGGTQSFGGFASVTQATAELITTPRYAGPLQDSNFWGRQLILGLPLAGALTVRALQSGRRTAALAGIAAIFALLSGVYLTHSRGTMIATAVVLIVWVLASGPGARRTGLRSLPLLALVLAVPGVGNRLLFLGADVFASGPKYGVDLSVLERTAAQEIAWAMFRDRPIFGVGPNAFEALVPIYAGRAATAVLNPTTGPHNLYAQLAGESGIVGLVGWTIFVGSFIWLLAVHVTRLSPISAVSDRSLAAAVLAALIGWSFASMFLHLAYFRTFGIILALAWAMVSVRSPKPDRAVASRPGKSRKIAVSAVLGAAGAAAALAVSGTQTYVASQTVTLLPTEQVTGHYAHALDVRSRDVIVPTYAALIAANTPGAIAMPDTVRGVITISVERADINSARAGLDIAWANAYSNLTSFRLDHNYTIATVGPIQHESRASHTPISIAAAVFTGVATAAMTMLVMLRISARQPRRIERTTGFGPTLWNSTVRYPATIGRRHS